MIVALRSDDLVYWSRRSDIRDEEKATDHVVVVVGLNEQAVYVNDPDFEQAPQ